MKKWQRKSEIIPSLKALERLAPGPEVIKTFSCSSQLCMKFLMLISIKTSRNSAFSGLEKLRMLFSRLKNVKMPTIVGIFTFMSRKKFHAQLS